MTKFVYDFAEGSRQMQDLLGGKGANIAEMSRILGADRVPGGFTITTEVCVAYMSNGGTQPSGLFGQRRASDEWRGLPVVWHGFELDPALGLRQSEFVGTTVTGGEFPDPSIACVEVEPQGRDRAVDYVMDVAVG